MSLSLRYAVRSHVGLLRDGNEDSGYAGSRLLVIADGMGGAVAGELASSVAVGTLARLDEDAPGGDFLDALGQAVIEANDHLRDIVSDNPKLEGMGTTLTAMLWNGNRFGMAHIGDSRAYRLRDGVFEQITADHSWVQRLVDEGRISEEEAAHHPQRSLLMRALDGREEVEIDLSAREVRPGDRYMLCSDGLSGVVSAETLQATLERYEDREQAVDALIQLALRGGGPDNVTCIVADAVEGPDVGPEVPVMVGAAAEGGAAGMQRLTGDPRQSFPGVATQPPNDDIPHTPAGRAARLRGRPDMPPADPADPTAGEHDRPRRRWRKPVLVIGAVIVVILGAGGGGYYWTQQQYYVGEAPDGHVAIYRGLSEQFAGLHLSRVYEHDTLKASALPGYERSQLADTISASDLSNARGIVTQLDKRAQQCAEYRIANANHPTATATATTRPTATATGTAKPTATPSGRATGRPTATAKATATAVATAPSLPNPDNDLAATCGSGS